MQTMVSVGSISHAMRAKRLLEQHGIRAYVRQSTGSSAGCGYSLLIPAYTPQTAALLRANGLLMTNDKERAAL